ncbi:MAG: DUF3048 domain-containing protein [Tyzzerella sp.]|nr:DUF3048 domain-containing protein [Tyzzerella sp.]
MRKIGCLLGIFITMSLLAGCGDKGASANGSTDLDTSLDIGIPQVTEEDLTARQNLLTGLNDLTKEAIGKRPVAVMVNNVEEALPQYGVAQADVIFEIPVEGNLTRLMALYADYTQIPKICAIRSCRYYYPAIAKGFDAYYVHWGQDQTITSYLNSLKMDRFDGLVNTGGLFGRDSARRSAGYSLEHTGYFDGTSFVNAVSKNGMRTDLLESKQGTAFDFHEVGEIVKPQGDECSKVHINFGAATATLTYDAATDTYLKQINGSAHMDGVTGTQLAFTNVFVLETSISTRDEVGHKSVDWEGSSSAVGYYISNGAVQKIHWSKADEASYLKFYDENGQELVINRGKSYIAINYKNKATFE